MCVRVCAGNGARLTQLAVKKKQKTKTRKPELSLQIQEQCGGGGGAAPSSRLPRVTAGWPSGRNTANMKAPGSPRETGSQGVQANAPLPHTGPPPEASDDGVLGLFPGPSIRLVRDHVCSGRGLLGPQASQHDALGGHG